MYSLALLEHRIFYTPHKFMRTVDKVEFTQAENKTKCATFTSTKQEEGDPSPTSIKKASG